CPCPPLTTPPEWQAVSVSQRRVVDLELEARAELHLERVAVEARNEPDGLLERHTAGIPAIVAAEVRPVEQIEELGKHVEFSIGPGEAEGFRRPHIQQYKRVAALRIHRHLLAGRRIDVPIV